MTTFTTTARVAAPSSIKSQLISHPLLAYFGIAFAGTWAMLLVPVLAQNGLGVLPFMVPDIAMLVLFIAATIAGPILGAIVMTALGRRQDGTAAILSPLCAGAGRAALVPAGAARLSADRAAGRGMRLFRPGAVPDSAGAVAADLHGLSGHADFMIMPGLAEEPGWRGFALPRLQWQYGPLLGALILGLLHMLWHLPVFFMTKGQMAMGPFNAGDFAYKIFSSLVLTVIWTWIFNNAKGSIFMALVLHGAGNAISMLTNGWGPMFSTASVSTLADNVLGVCALLIIIVTRGRLAYTPGLALPAAGMPQTKDVLQA